MNVVDGFLSASSMISSMTPTQGAIIPDMIHLLREAAYISTLSTEKEGRTSGTEGRINNHPFYVHVTFFSVRSP